MLLKFSKSSLLSLMSGSVLALGAISVSGFMSSAYAQAPTEGRQFSAKAGEVVNEALQLINSNQHSAALGKLGEALNISPLNAYERSTIYQMQGASYYELNQFRHGFSRKIILARCLGPKNGSMPPARKSVSILT